MSTIDQAFLNKLASELATLRAQREELRECIAYASVLIRRIGTAKANDPKNIDRAQKWLNLCREMLIKTEPE